MHDAARESARRLDGQFGAQARTESLDVALDETGQFGDVDPAGDDAYLDALASLRAILDEDEPRPAPTDLAGLEATGADLPPLVFSHTADFDPRSCAAITNANHTKPDGGVWLSPGTPNGPSTWDGLLDSEEYRGSAVEFSRRDRRRQAVALDPDALVLRIDSREDLLRAADAYPGHLAGLMSSRAVDFEALAERYAAIWVTDAGIRANHMPRDGRDESLYGWEIESVVVLDASAVRTDH